ncbi:MAG TPA: hypothetical protein VK483_09150 [Chitinophagaceae bacterium]|nr:hypothetical protein [Chitinophagaceae bacterium]
MTELLHDYYSNLQCWDFDVVPSEETRLLMKNRQMMYKLVGNKLIVLVKVITGGADENKPFISMNPADKFLFYLQPSRPKFSIVTNIDVDKLREGKRYYFTNLHQNDLDGGLSLTKKIEPVPGPANYVPGDLTASGGIVYECIKSTNETNNPPAPAFWQDRGNQQYVSGADMIVPKTRIGNYTVNTEAKRFTISVSGLNLTNNQYDLNIPVKENLFTTDKETKQVQVKLPELIPGKYRVKINADVFDVFIDDAVVYNNVFGVIEIFSHLSNGPGFAFLGADGKVKDKSNAGIPEWLTYKIQFANRLAYWKYNTPRHGVTAITDAGSLYTFDPTPAAPGNKDFFTSAKPIPLLETPWKFKVNVQSLSNDEDPLAPNPDPDITAMLSRTETEKDYYCTINLNY